MHKIVILCVFSYVLGSVPFSYLIAKWIGGIDIRKTWDGNIGATNVYRVAGKKAGIAAFLCDVAKGALPVLAAVFVLRLPEYACVLTGLCSIIGHNWPLFLGFRGGKGLSTTIGVIGALVPAEGAILLIPFFILYQVFKHGTFAIMLVGPFLPVVCFLKGMSGWIIWGTILIFVFVYLGAVGNFAKIWNEVKTKGRSC